MIKQLNISTLLYNPAFPSDLTIIKDLPSSIRTKGEELINVISTLESKRVSQTLDEVISLFPDVKSVFIQGNGKLPDGLYNKRGDAWIGLGNFNYLPSDSTNLKEGTRIVVENRVFELMFDEGYKVWAERPYFFPSIFFDLFLVQDVTVEQILDNRGNGDPAVDLGINKVKLRSEFYLPYLISTVNSTVGTKSPVAFKESFTFTSTFLKISREFQDGSETVIAPANDGVLMFVRDEFENVKIGLAYDKDYNLVFFDNVTKTKLNETINENENYQISFVYNRGTLEIYKDSKLIHSVEKPIISNKNLYFSICNDMGFGQYSNAGATFGEIQVFEESLSPDELIWIKNNPRTWSFKEAETYLDLSIEEKIKLKNFLAKI